MQECFACFDCHGLAPPSTGIHLCMDNVHTTPFISYESICLIHQVLLRLTTGMHAGLQCRHLHRTWYVTISNSRLLVQLQLWLKAMAPVCDSSLATHTCAGDVALSVLMTTASTLGAIIMTPLLTQLLAGTLVPVDSKVLPSCRMPIYKPHISP